MPARKRPVAEDAVTARQTLLAGLARNADITERVSGLAPLHLRDETFPGEVFLSLAADALNWCGACPPGRDRTWACSMRPPGGSPATSGSTPCPAAVACIRAAASRAGVPPAGRACQDLTQGPAGLAGEEAGG